jgi:hypothetical protein
MSPAELLAALDHVAECNTCREQFQPEQRIHEVGDALRSDLQAQAQYSNHLTYEDSAFYVDECLGEIEREIVESHLDLCGQCATEIADLRAFRAEITTYPEIERVPARPSTGRIISFWRAAAFRIPIQLAAAASILLLCGLIATLLLRKDSSKLTQVSELQQPNETPQPQPPPVETQKIPEANASSQVVYEIQDGAGSVTLDKEGKIAGLESLPLSYRQAVEAGLTNKRVERPAALQGLVGRTGSLMGGRGEDTTFSLIGPIGTVVKSDKPTFRWNALNGATSYAITVYDPNFNKVTASEQQPGTEWTPSQPLERGGLYSWQVTAVREGKEIMSPTPPAPDAKFKVLETSTASELERAKRTYAQSHLVLGILYERAGLIDDAEREFKSLYRANPKSQIVRKLLRDVQSLRQPR